MLLFTQFLLRLTFGLAASMALTSPRTVSSGYYRNNLYVTLGLTSLAALVSRVRTSEAVWLAVAAAIVSYVTSILWLYEKPGIGRRMLVVLAAISWVGAINISAELSGSEHKNVIDKYIPSASVSDSPSVADAESMTRRPWRHAIASVCLGMISNVSSGLLLGTTMAAMLLGHWYLNSPTMQLAPLRRLIVAMAWAVGFQIVVSALGLAAEIATAPSVAAQLWMFLALRWLFGLVGVVILIAMAWRTLDIPNTQSATGILYVAVIGVFVGETMSLLLSRESLFPL